jgi:hypothetical protein
MYIRIFTLLVSASYVWLLTGCKSTASGDEGNSELEFAKSGISYTVDDAVGYHRILMGLKRTATITIPSFNVATTKIGATNEVNTNCGDPKPKAVREGTGVVVELKITAADSANYRSCAVAISDGSKSITISLVRSETFTQVYFYDEEAPSAKTGAVIGRPAFVSLSGLTNIESALIEINGLAKITIKKLSGTCTIASSSDRTKVIEDLSQGPCTLKVSGGGKHSDITFLP